MVTWEILNYKVSSNLWLSFVLDNKLEAYYTPDGKVATVDAYVKPQVKFTKKVNDNLSWHAAVAYEVVNLEASDDETTSVTKSWNDNEMEITLGFKVK